MNKILVYTVIAILLGSVTMVVPLALLGPSNLIPDDKYINNESGEETFERNDVLASPDASAEQSGDTETYDISPTEATKSESTLGETDVVSDLSSIGLMAVPSFLVALGVFVYLKKRMI
ncbi:MAG: hypothetical protein IBV52_05635 [Candidatus Bathyarchaeota archaeon]